MMARARQEPESIYSSKANTMTQRRDTSASAQENMLLAAAQKNLA